MNISPSDILTYLREELDRLGQEKATGELAITHAGIPMTIFLLSGRLQYVTDSEHRMRRWKRATFQHCATWTQPTAILNSQPWEYDFLYQGISKKHLTLEQAKHVISAIASECWYELALTQNIEVNWVPCDRQKSTFSYFLSLSATEVHPDIREAELLRQEWHQAGLDQYRPSLSPVLTAKGNTLNNPAVQRYLNGQFSVWDVALQLKQPIPKVMRSLLSWQDKELITFQTIPDLPAPVEEMQKTVATPAATVSTRPASGTTSATPGTTPAETQSNTIPVSRSGQFLVACIDDSPIVIHNLKSILGPAGFQVLSIPEPMAGFAQLIEHKPDLILLDLNMPNANGYSICKFLRETPVFGQTPIIILTAQDNVIDRTRAKLVGANDFISKPPEPQALVQLIHKYLAPKTGENAEVVRGGVLQTA
ncbi:MAG: response regulator [Microcystaceae cyanobacterium]